MTPDRDDPTDERTEARGRRTIPEDGDQGKDVVDTRGQEIGVVTGVEGDTMYVDPDPSVTDRIKGKLRVGSESETDLPISPEFVDRIEDDVVLDVERDEEFQEETS